MEAWIAFWKYILGGGVVVYYLMALFLVPIAFRDMVALARKLSKNGSDDGPGDPNAQPIKQ